MPLVLCPRCRDLIPATRMPTHRLVHRRGPKRDGRNGTGSSPGYARARRLALERDDHRCQGCGRTDKLETHHIDEDWRNNDVDNLVTVCVDCHPRRRTPGEPPIARTVASRQHPVPTRGE